MGVISSLTPLSYSPEMVEAILGYAQARQALLMANLAMAGSTAPITVAGLLALQNAELLAGIVLVQLVGPGTPVVYGTTSTNIDMRSGALAIGSPELAQIVSAHMQIVRYYGLPSRGSGALTDANYPNAQAGLESMMGLLSLGLCRGTEVTIRVNGGDEERIGDRLVELFEREYEFPPLD